MVEGESLEFVETKSHFLKLILKFWIQSYFQMNLQEKNLKFF
jgi:hypothetical protein